MSHSPRLPSQEEQKTKERQAKERTKRFSRRRQQSQKRERKPESQKKERRPDIPNDQQQMIKRKPKPNEIRDLSNELDYKLDQDDEMKRDEKTEFDKKMTLTLKISEIKKMQISKEDEEEAAKIMVTHWDDGPRIKKICKNGKWYVTCGRETTLVLPFAKFVQELLSMLSESELEGLGEEDDIRLLHIPAEYID